MTQFQQLCYQTLKNQVPAGKVITYARLAKLIGNPKAYRAVGNAMNKNPFAPEIPCHRVVKANGDLGGFAYDISLKIKRLQAEGVSVKNGKIVNYQNICLLVETSSIQKQIKVLMVGVCCREGFIDRCFEKFTILPFLLKRLLLEGFMAMRCWGVSRQRYWGVTNPSLLVAMRWGKGYKYFSACGNGGGRVAQTLPYSFLCSSNSLPQVGKGL
jgi:methylated-DNA-[protein]-cysteine S-methyltransferase